jgi:hypothetical protein
VRHVRVISGLLVVATFVLVGGRLMMLDGVFEIFSGFAEILGNLGDIGLPPAFDHIGPELLAREG